MQKIIKDFSAINLFFFVISRKMTSQGRSENSDQSGPLHPMLPNADRFRRAAILKIVEEKALGTRLRWHHGYQAARVEGEEGCKDRLHHLSHVRDTGGECGRW